MSATVDLAVIINDTTVEIREVRPNATVQFFAKKTIDVPPVNRYMPGYTHIKDMDCPVTHELVDDRGAG